MDTSMHRLYINFRERGEENDEPDMVWMEQMLQDLASQSGKL